MAPPYAKPIGPARCSLFGPDCRASQVLCEVRSHLAKSCKKNKDSEKTKLAASKFIGNSSPLVTVIV